METLQSRLIRPKNMQEYNAYIVLEYLRHNGPRSRADISRALGFSRSAISNIVELLEEYRLVRYSGIGHPHTGRKSRLLEFNPLGRYFVGVDLSWQEKV
ncbi:MarR family transcriptional regulator, partial [Salinispira pacifica]